MTYSIHVNQEEFCNGLKPVVIEHEKSRSVGDPLSPTEVSQTRALLMKAQWRALQTAPQFCARINLASSSVATPTLATLQEANNIIKDMRKTSKEDIVFHSFNYFRKSNDQLDFRDVIFLHWGDAGHKNRPGNHSTGGLISGMSTPEILQGYETPVSLIDWKSWKLRRVSAGSNGSEAQGICEAEDKGWKCRLMWALLNGLTLKRDNADILAATFLAFLIMDSRGCYDALTGTETPGLSMDNSRSSVDILATSQGLTESSNCHAAWVPGDWNLADSLTKHSTESQKTMMLYHQRKSWILKFNNEFISARKQQKMRRQKAQSMQDDLPDEWWSDPFARRFGTALER